MHKGFLKAGVVFAFLAVAIGAFGAHALRDILSIREKATFEKGVQYQFYHALALIVSGILHRNFPVKNVRRAGRLFVAGIMLFSFSLYILSIMKTIVMPGYKYVAMITPFGGVCFLAGWALLFYTFIRNRETL